MRSDSMGLAKSISMREDYPDTGEFADAVRVLLYGDGDIRELTQDLAEVLAKYDDVPADALSNKLLKALK